MNCHPSDAALLAYSECAKRMGGDAAVGAHLAAGCERCRARVDEYEEILVYLRSPALQVAPEDLVRCALDRIVQLQGEGAPSADGLRGAAGRFVEGVSRHLREVRMALVLDSRPGAVLPGIRSETALQPRQILFESAEGSVHLQIQRTKSRRFELTGQFIPFRGGLGRGTRAMLEGEGHRVKRRLAATGEFRFPSVVPGRLQLALECDDLRLTAGPFEIREDTDA